MKKIILSICAVFVAVLLSSCGGGDSSATAVTPPKYSQLILFGDSLSDGGTYQVGTIDSIGGGKFTVNSPTAKVWIEQVSDYFGYPRSCAAQTGLPFVIVPNFIGASIVDHPECTNYAQGAARVSSPYGNDSIAMQQWVLTNGTQAQAVEIAPLGKMATSAINQMKMHLARNGGSYTGKELVVVSIGANDLFLNIDAIPKVKIGGFNALISSVFADWDRATQLLVSTTGTTSSDQDARTQVALQAGHAYMSNAATELLTNVKTLILDKGAKNVVIMNLSDIGLTPAMLDEQAQPSALATSLTKAFNDTLAVGIRRLPGVLLVDTFSESQRQAANPAQYGLTNVKDVACGKAPPPYENILDASSLGCSAATVIPGDISHYLYADGVHPTPYGHLLLANFFTKSLEIAGMGR